MLFGTKVLDLSRVLAGPLCTMMLADMGADIIKVERPGTGDETRGWGPPFDLRGESAYYLSVNRNKKSVAANLDVETDRDLILKLAGEADVVVDNFRRGTPRAAWHRSGRASPPASRSHLVHHHRFRRDQRQGWLRSGRPGGERLDGNHGRAEERSDARRCRPRRHHCRQGRRHRHPCRSRVAIDPRNRGARAGRTTNSHLACPQRDGGVDQRRAEFAGHRRGCEALGKPASQSRPVSTFPRGRPADRDRSRHRRAVGGLRRCAQSRRSRGRRHASRPTPADSVRGRELSMRLRLDSSSATRSSGFRFSTREAFPAAS